VAGVETEEVAAEVAGDKSVRRKVFLNYRIFKLE
jgi:hypothetical protein